MTIAIAASQHEGSFGSQGNRIGGFAWCEILDSLHSHLTLAKTALQIKHAILV